MPTRVPPFPFVIIVFIAGVISSLILLPTSRGQETVDAQQGVIWTSVVNCTVSGTVLQKTAGRTDSADAGARSQQTVPSGDVLFEFTAGDSTKTLFCGLTHSALDSGYTEIDFAIKLTDFGVAEVRENNVYATDTPYRVGDVFRVSVQSNVVTYSRNGGLFYSSSKRPVYPLFADASFLTLGGRIDNAVLGAPAVTTSADWAMYQHDQSHSGFSTTSLVNSSNVATLAPAWSFATGDWVTGTPIVADGVVYVGSWDGKMYALRERDGSLVWSFSAGTLRVDPCQTTYGIDSSANLSGGKLYFGTGLAQLIALNASNGQLIWRSQLADPAQAFHIFGSPLVFDGKIYIGLASHCVTPCVTGRLVCVDASDGRVLWNFATAPEGSLGGAVWSSVAVDAGRRMVYVGTGNYCGGTDTHSSAVIAINADTGAIVWEFKKLRNDLNNLDFGASPCFFDINGTPGLAIPSKDGHCYALNRATGDLLWDTVVTDGNSQGGSICSPAAAYGKIFFGATVQLTTGKVVALDQRDGRIVWQTPQARPFIGAPAVAGGVVFIGCSEGKLRGYDVSTGAEVWSTPQLGSFLGGVSISSSNVFIGSLDHKVYAFALPTSVTPPPPPSPPPAADSVSITSPNAGDDWTTGQKYSISWNASAGVSRVDVSISRDAGASWESLASGIAATPGALTVKAKKPKSEAALVRVTDSSNNSMFGQSGMFHIR